MESTVVSNNLVYVSFKSGLLYTTHPDTKSRDSQIDEVKVLFQISSSSQDANIKGKTWIRLALQNS